MRSDLMGELNMLVYNGSAAGSPHWQVNVANALSTGLLEQFETDKPNEVKELTVELVNRKYTYITACLEDKWVIKLIKKESDNNEREQVSESV